MSFLFDYWRGRRNLGFSFWVVFSGLTILLNFFEPLLLKSFFLNPDTRINATFISLSVTRLIVYPWQFVGLLRAVDRCFLASNKTLQTRVIQALMLLSVVYAVVYSVGLIQDAYIDKKVIEQAGSRVLQAPVYTLTIGSNARQLQIRGDFEIGITKAVTDFIETHPDITMVLLESHGGQIYEGRGLSKLFTRNKLDTLVETYCSSACASAFVGGKERMLGKDAKLGFHQYKLDFSVHKRAVGFHKPEDEQQRDRDLFKSRGVSSVFLNKMFTKNADEMWFPSHAELIEENVVHQSLQ